MTFLQVLEGQMNKIVVSDLLFRCFSVLLGRNCTVAMNKFLMPFE